MCKLELDIFSGRPNPVCEISNGEFLSLYNQARRLEDAKQSSLFDGLGFRGFILTGPGTKITLQKNLVKIQSARGAQYKKNSPRLIVEVLNIAEKYDKNNSYSSLLAKIHQEYLGP